MDECYKIKQYSCREETELGNKKIYVLSFSNIHHIKVSELAYKIIKEFDGVHTLEEIIMNLNEQEVNISRNEITKFVDTILIPNDMLEGIDPEKKQKKKSKLWVRIPVIESSKFKYLYKLLSCLLNDKVTKVLISIVAIMIFYVFFLCATDKSLSMIDMSVPAMAILIYASMFLHEIGHLTACNKYGVKAGKIGVGFYMIFFVFYVDMTNSWRLNKKQRVVADLAGMYFQILMVIPICIMYFFNHNSIFLFTVIGIFSVTIMNIFPFIKLDGYWFLCDLLGVQNIDVHVLYSIKTLCKSIFNRINKKDKEKIDISVVVYGVYSLIYLICIILIFGYMFISTYNIFLNSTILADMLNTVKSYWLSAAFIKMLGEIKNILMYLLPAIILLFIVLKVVIGFISSILKGSKEK